MNSNPSPANLNRRILLVDDNRAIHEDFRKILGKPAAATIDLDAAEAAMLGESALESAPEGFELDSAYQGQEAVERVRQAVAEGRPYAMAFVDMRMPPGWDGIETTVRIWEIDSDLQVVICTAYSDYSWGDMVAKLGHSDQLLILKKPFDTIEALQLAHSNTEKWRLLKESRARVSRLESDLSARAVVLENTNFTLRSEIIERQRAEKDRQKIEVQLRSAQKLEAIGQLAAGIAHEINTPTQFIGDNLRFVRDAFVDLLALQPAEKRLIESARLGTPPPELVREIEAGRSKADVDYLSLEIPKALSQALEGVERVTKIVRSMKEFSHPGVAEKQSLDLNHAIETTITVSRNEWKYVADLTTELDPQLPTVPVLPGEFNQAVLNLIVNAAHAIGDVARDGGAAKGHIHITTRRDQDWVEIRIADNGTGIPESARARIFEPFFTTKAVGKGTGQGLAIAHNVVVEKHNGTLAFETEVGVGTTFVIRLPVNPLVAGANGSKLP